MSIVIWILICLACVAAGAVGHAFFRKEVAASDTDLKTWAARLRSAIAQDERTAKAAVDRICLELEQKVQKKL